MTGNRPLNGYLDRMRRNITSLDESIESVRKGPKGEKPAEKRARLKLLRDMVELQNASLLAVKTHLLGRDETGSPTEPADTWDGDANDQVEFERLFKNALSPWTHNDLKVKCVDCGVESEEVSGRELEGWSGFTDLCNACLKKRENDLLLECEECRVKAEDVEKRDLPGQWVGGVMLSGDSVKLCEKCWEKKTVTRT